MRTRQLAIEANLSSLGRRLGLGSAGGVVGAATHDHVGLVEHPGDHCEKKKVVERTGADGQYISAPGACLATRQSHKG